MYEPRYQEIATFMRAPYQPDLDGVDIALFGVPYDGGVTNRPGARHGPREIRNQSSMMRTINHTSRINPFEICSVADVGDVRFSRVYDNGAVTADIEAFLGQVLAAGALPLAAGGDHSITYPIFRALASSQEPLGMIHIDAHTDTWGPFRGEKFHHGSPFRLACDEGLLDPARTIQIGIRGAQNWADGWEYSDAQGMRVVFIEELESLGVQGVIAEARRVVGDGPTYLSFDVDGLDPVYAPGTGTPEVGGITTREALGLLRGLRGLDLVGGDVVEVSPPFDPSGGTALVGATLMYEILCLLAEVRVG
ncbi:MAG: agmatinase [Actinomycetia bacterium]|nr:agmatinase [Actinomycetes bacterium]MCP5032727.1 agmatinase [Actinomycetes bacterium]